MSVCFSTQSLESGACKRRMDFSRVHRQARHRLLFDNIEILHNMGPLNLSMHTITSLKQILSDIKELKAGVEK